MSPCDEIEITDAMIDAGVRVLWDSGFLYSIADGPDQVLVAEILTAVFRARSETLRGPAAQLNNTPPPSLSRP